MKLKHYGKTVILTLGIAMMAVFGGSSTSQAHDRDGRDWDRDRYHHSRYYHRHYWDYHRHPRGAYYRYYTPRTYVYYRGDRGYWDNRGGVRVFIRIP